MSEPIVAAQTSTAEDARQAVREHLARIPELMGDLDGFGELIDRLTGYARTVDANNRLVFDPNTLERKAAKRFAPDDPKLRKKARRIIRKRFGAFMLDPGHYLYQADHHRAIQRELAVQAQQDRQYAYEEGRRRLRDQEREATGQASISDSLLDYEALMSRPGLEPLIEGVIAQSTSALIFAPPGVGKSFVAVSMACSVASGHDWIGRPVASGPVLIVLGEGDAGYGARIAAWSDAWNGGAPIANLYVYPRALDMSSTDVAAELAEVVADIDPALVIFDTLNRVAGDAEENSSTAMSGVLRNIDAVRQAGTRTTTLLIHHAGKNGDMRGSNALLGNPDTVLELKGDPGLLELRAVKQKDAAGGTVGHFRLKQSPTRDTLVLEGVLPGQGQPQGAQAARVEEALAHFVRAFGETGSSRAALVDYLAEWMQAGKSTAQQYVGDLIASGRVTATRQGTRSTWLELAPTRATFPLTANSTTD